MELKPCPFCGGDAHFEQTAYGTDCGMVSMRFQIRCKNCHAAAPNGGGQLRLDLNSDGDIRFATDERTKAITAWNRRANDGSHE